MKVLLFDELGSSVLEGEEALGAIGEMEMIGIVVIHELGTNTNVLVLGSGAFFDRKACSWERLVARYCVEVELGYDLIWGSLPCAAYYRSDEFISFVGAWGNSCDQISKFRGTVKLALGDAIDIAA